MPMPTRLAPLILACAAASVACGGPSPAAAPERQAPAASQCHARHVNLVDPQAWEPDVACTPGSLANGIPAAQLCPTASTQGIRPLTSWIERLKKRQMLDYGDTDSAANYEEDHLIPLELGGSPTSAGNLWPEPHPSLNEKDRVENAAHAAVCRGTLSLADAQRRIAVDWYTIGRDIHVIP